MSKKMTPRRWAEAITVRILMLALGALPLDTASRIGGMIGRRVGPMTGIHRKARRQMMEILPDLSPTRVDAYLNEMWDNLGRTMAEYPHLPRIMNERLTLDDRAGIDLDHIRDNAAIFIAGHFANWEVAGPSLLHFTGAKVNLLYRAANNTAVDRTLNYYRSMNGVLTTIPKSRAGTRALIDNIRAGNKIGILIDQKYNEGIAAPFFGKMAMTTTAYVQMGQKFKCPVYPAQIIRMGGAHFRVVMYPPLRLFDENGAPRPMADVVADAHALLESWMREHPGQWLWIHQRWSSKILLEQAQNDNLG